MSNLLQAEMAEMIRADASLSVKMEQVQTAMHLAARYAASASQSVDLGALQQEACQVAAEGLKSNFAKMLVYKSDKQDFLMEAGVGWRSGVIGSARLDSDVGTAAGFAWHTGEAVISNAFGDDKRFRVPDVLTAHGLSSSINVSIPGDDQMAFGVLEVGSPRTGEFDQDGVCFLLMLSYSFTAARKRLAKEASYEEQAARSVDEHQMSLLEMQHRVRNDLQGIYGSIEQEIRKITDAEQQTGYGRIGNRILAIAMLYDHLFVMPLVGTVEMGAYLTTLCSRIARAADLSSRGIELVAEIQPVGMTVEQAGQLAVVINELVANAAKHAFPDRQNGRIVVRLADQTAFGSGHHILTVSDDGCGFRGPRPGGAGLRFVDRLVRHAGGVLTRLDGTGTEWRIALSSGQTADDSAIRDGARDL